MTILEQDYRSLSGSFDRVMSIGMFEHVGPHNYPTYLDAVRSCLKSDGLFLLHTIGADRSRWALDGWLDRYIFPNACIPSARWLTAGTEERFVIEDWHNFWPDYDRTLLAWYDRLEQAWTSLQHGDERQRRIWRYYLLSCAGSFRARKNQLWQIVLSPHGVMGGYLPVR